MSVEAAWAALCAAIALILLGLLLFAGCSTLTVSHRRKADRHSGLVVVEVGMGESARVELGDRCDAGTDAGSPDAAAAAQGAP